MVCPAGFFSIRAGFFRIGPIVTTPSAPKQLFGTSNSKQAPFTQDATTMP